jgi:hypothetical protein
MMALYLTRYLLTKGKKMNLIKSKMKYNGWNCNLELTSYARNNQSAILLTSDEGLPIAKATTCIDYNFQEGETAIKDWSENEGMLKALISNGIVADTGKRAECGFTTAAIVQLIVEQE